MPVQRQENDDSISQYSTTAWRVIEIFIAEMLGTGMLLFFGCMGSITWVEDVPLPPYQGALVFSVVVASVIQVGTYFERLNISYVICNFKNERITILCHRRPLQLMLWASSASVVCKHGLTMFHSSSSDHSHIVQRQPCPLSRPTDCYCWSVNFKSPTLIKRSKDLRRNVNDTWSPCAWRRLTRSRSEGVHGIREIYFYKRCMIV